MLTVSILGSITAALFFLYFSKDFPNIITTEDYKPLTVTRVISRGGVVVGEFYEERRYIVAFEEIPEIVVKSFLAAEDDRFFEHQGIDLQGVLRAAIANFRAGRVVQGGSTITQQVAKSLLLTPERSFVRKLKEAIIANRMEKNLTKQQILYLYLNQIYLGQGAYGVAAAAKVYFNKEIKDLSLAEASILAGLPQAPSAYSPSTNPKKAKERQLYVLRRLVEDGAISRAEAEEASNEPIKLYIGQDINDRYAPYYVEHIRRHLVEKYGRDVVYRSGLTVQVPLEPNLSEVAMKAVREGLRVVDKKQGYRGPIKKNKGTEEIESAIRQVAEYNITRKYPYKLLMPDGTHSNNPVVRMGGGTELNAFVEGEIYQGVVIKIDENKKESIVDLGFQKGVIPFETMKWARPVSAPSSTPLEPIEKISQALARGDQIWVRFISKNGKNVMAPPVLELEQTPAVQGALLAMDSISGQVLSMVGGFDFSESEFNRAVQAARQAGSSFKPIIYAAAVDKGYTPSTVIQDSPIVFNKGENEKWKPENYEEKFYGDTLFRSALIHSRNVPTIKIVQDIGISYLIDYAKRLGLGGVFNPDLSISLGSNTVSLLDLVRVYAIFPRGGRIVKPIFINKVVDRDGKILEENDSTPIPPPTGPVGKVFTPLPKPVLVAGELQVEAAQENYEDTRGIFTPDPADPDRVMDIRTAYVVTHLMNEVTKVGTGHQVKNLGRPAAGKTGTTQEAQDAWFMGFTPQLVTGVWVGFDTQKSLGPKSTGAMVALPIWMDYMKEAVKLYTPDDFLVPPGVSLVYIDPKTGRACSPNKPNAVKEAYISGSEPSGFSSIVQTPMPSIQGAQQKPTESPVKQEEEISSDATVEDFLKEDIQ